MIGLVDAIGRVTVSRYRAGVWLLLFALLLGGVMAAATEPAPTIHGRAALTATAAPGDDATLPDPKARNRGTPAETAIPVPRGKRSSPPAPQSGYAGMAATFAKRPDACRLPSCQPMPAPPPAATARRLAYDPHGPPFPAP